MRYFRFEKNVPESAPWSDTESPKQNIMLVKAKSKYQAHQACSMFLFFQLHFPVLPISVSVSSLGLKQN